MGSDSGEGFHSHSVLLDVNSEACGSIVFGHYLDTRLRGSPGAKLTKHRKGTWVPIGGMKSVNDTSFAGSLRL